MAEDAKKAETEEMSKGTLLMNKRITKVAFSCIIARSMGYKSILLVQGKTSKLCKEKKR